MTYTVNKLAKLSGVSTRTLRYYDEIGLLKPAYIADNGYRMYQQQQVDLLQQILLYRELGLQLEEISRIILAPEFDKEKALKTHLSELIQRKNQIQLLIENVTMTLSTLKGERVMSDMEKFEGFKEKLIEENEKKYGKEIRTKYGEDKVNALNARVKGMSEEKWQKAQTLSEAINDTLKQAFEQGDPASELAQRACEMHKEWICMFWQEGMYSKEAHKNLAEGYVADPRFTAYYDQIAEGCTKFLQKAINIYCS